MRTTVLLLLHTADPSTEIPFTDAASRWRAVTHRHIKSCIRAETTTDLPLNADPRTPPSSLVLDPQNASTAVEGLRARLARFKCGYQLAKITRE